MQRLASLHHDQGSSDDLRSGSGEKSLVYGKIKPLGGGRFAKVSLLEKDRSLSSVATSTSADELESKKVYSKSVDISAAVNVCKCGDLERDFVALKRVSRRYQSKRSFHREIQSQADASNHPCVTKLMTSFVYETETEFGMGLEYSPHGDLASVVIPGVGLPEVIVKSCVLQISHALQYIHKKKFAHLDLKPENILIHDRERFHIKLCDFGSARELKSNGPQLDPLFCTPYTPPEMLRHVIRRHPCEDVISEGEEICPHLPQLADKNKLICRKRFVRKSPTSHDLMQTRSQPRDSPSKPKFEVTTGCDVWSLGVLLIYLMSGETPWNRACRRELGYKEFVLWRNGDFSIMPRIFENFTNWSRELLVGVLNPVQDSRWPFPVFKSLVRKEWCQVPVERFAPEKQLFCDPLDGEGSNRCGKCFCCKNDCLCRFI